MHSPLSVSKCEVTGNTEVRVWQVNQGYGMKVHVPAGVDAPLQVEAGEEPELLNLAGIPGCEPPVYVEILEPHVGKPLLPTGVMASVDASGGRKWEDVFFNLQVYSMRFAWTK